MVQTVSEILWCDPGNHQFNANDQDRKTWTEQQTYKAANEGQRPMRFDACSQHRGYDGMGNDAVAKAFNDMQKAAQPALPAAKGTRIVNADEYGRYIKYLEDQNGVGSDNTEIQG